MTEINTRVGLPIAALQDLRAAAALLAERLPEIAAHVCDAGVANTFRKLSRQAGADAACLLATGKAAGGPPNLWMTGILDDADRDARSTAPGPLLDTALIGAIRKGLASAIVSYDTAIALAAPVPDALRAAKTCQSAAIDADRVLARLLVRIQGTTAFGNPDHTSS